MKNKKIISIFVATILLGIVFLYFIQPISINGVQVGFSFKSVSKEWLVKAGLPVGAVDVSEIEITAEEGTMPEMALWSFNTDRNYEQLKIFYLSRCSEMGLSRSVGEQLKVEPDILCDGRSGSGLIRIYLYSQCKKGICRATVEVRHWSG